MNKLEVQPVEIASDYYKKYAVYVNDSRALAGAKDGLKVLYRRMLYTVLQYPKDKKIKSAELQGAVMKLHPHSEQSIYPLVISNLGLFDKQGNFGSRILEGAAARYTECCINDVGRAYLGGDLVNYCEMEEGELGHMEPKSLPTLIPYILTEGNKSMGVGLSSSIPRLNIMDLLHYFKEGLRGLDTQEVKLEYGDIHIPLTAEEVSKKVKSGIMNKIPMYSNVYNNGINELYVYDYPDGVALSKLKTSVKSLEDGDLLDIIDNSKDTLSLTYEIVNSKKLSILTVRDKLEQATKKSNSYSYLFAHNNQFCRMNLSQLRDLTLTNLRECCNRKFTKELNKLEKDKQVLLVLKYIKDSNLLVDITKYSKDKLIKHLIKNTSFQRVDIESALSKSISRLLKGTSDEELKQIEKQIKSIQAELKDPTAYLESLYDTLEGLLKVESKTTYKGSKKTDKILYTKYAVINKKGELVLHDSYVRNSSKLTDSKCLALYATGKVVPIDIREFDITTKVDFIGIQTYYKDRRYFIKETENNAGIAFDASQIPPRGRLIVEGKDKKLELVLLNKSKQLKCEGKTLKTDKFMVGDRKRKTTFTIPNKILTKQG